MNTEVNTLLSLTNNSVYHMATRVPADGSGSGAWITRCHSWHTQHFGPKPREGHKCALIHDASLGMEDRNARYQVGNACRQPPLEHDDGHRQPITDMSMWH